MGAAEFFFLLLLLSQGSALPLARRCSPRAAPRGRNKRHAPRAAAAAMPPCCAESGEHACKEPQRTKIDASTCCGNLRRLLPCLFAAVFPALLPRDFHRCSARSAASGSARPSPGRLQCGGPQAPRGRRSDGRERTRGNATGASHFPPLPLLLFFYLSRSLSRSALRHDSRHPRRALPPGGRRRRPSRPPRPVYDALRWTVLAVRLAQGVFSPSFCAWRCRCSARSACLRRAVCGPFLSLGRRRGKREEKREREGEKIKRKLVSFFLFSFFLSFFLSPLLSPTPLPRGADTPPRLFSLPAPTGTCSSSSAR